MNVERKNAVAAGEAGSAPADLMKAIVQDRFGPPDTLQLIDAQKPEIGPGEVLLKVHAAAVNPYDWHMLRGDPRIARLMGGVGLTRPKARIAGVDVAGRVHDVGADVHGLRPGDEVFGFAGEPSPSSPPPTPPWWCPSRPRCHSNRWRRCRWRP